MLKNIEREKGLAWLKSSQMNKNFYKVIYIFYKPCYYLQYLLKSEFCTFSKIQKRWY